jgi:hypothetical protein
VYLTRSCAFTLTRHAGVFGPNIEIQDPKLEIEIDLHAYPFFAFAFALAFCFEVLGVFGVVYYEWTRII